MLKVLHIIIIKEILILKHKYLYIYIYKPPKKLNDCLINQLNNLI